MCINLLQMRFHPLNTPNEERLPKILATLLVEWLHPHSRQPVQTVRLNSVLGNSLTKISEFLRGLSFLSRLYQLVQTNGEPFFSKIPEALNYISVCLTSVF